VLAASTSRGAGCVSACGSLCVCLTVDTTKQNGRGGHGAHCITVTVLCNVSRPCDSSTAAAAHCCGVLFAQRAATACVESSCLPFGRKVRACLGAHATRAGVQMPGKDRVTYCKPTGARLLRVVHCAMVLLRVVTGAAVPHRKPCARLTGTPVSRSAAPSMFGAILDTC
jgi:hypothetical protein